MAKSKKKSETVFLVCKETGDYNYTLKRKPGGEKLTLKKYCPTCRKHTEHNEREVSRDIRPRNPLSPLPTR